MTIPLWALGIVVRGEAILGTPTAKDIEAIARERMAKQEELAAVLREASKPQQMARMNAEQASRPGWVDDAKARAPAARTVYLDPEMVERLNRQSEALANGPGRCCADIPLGQIPEVLALPDGK